MTQTHRRMKNVHCTNKDTIVSMRAQTLVNTTLPVKVRILLQCARFQAINSPGLKHAVTSSVDSQGKKDAQYLPTPSIFLSRSRQIDQPVLRNKPSSREKVCSTYSKVQGQKYQPSAIAHHTISGSILIHEWQEQT